MTSAKSLQTYISHKRRAVGDLERDLKFPGPIEKEEISRPTKKITDMPFESSVSGFILPAPFTVHMQILSQEFAAFRTGDEAGLSLSIARMNAILIGERGKGPVLLNETKEAARTVVSKWISKLRGHLDALGTLTATDEKRKIYVCACLLVKKLEKFVKEGSTKFEPKSMQNAEPFPGPTVINNLTLISQKIQEECAELHPIKDIISEWIVKCFGTKKCLNACTDFIKKWRNFQDPTINDKLCQKPWLAGLLLFGSFRDISLGFADEA